jgi:hypothetical protein
MSTANIPTCNAKLNENEYYSQTLDDLGNVLSGGFSYFKLILIVFLLCCCCCIFFTNYRPVTCEVGQPSCYPVSGWHFGTILIAVLILSLIVIMISEIYNIYSTKKKLSEAVKNGRPCYSSTQNKIITL